MPSSKQTVAVLEALEVRWLLSFPPVVNTFTSSPASPITVGQTVTLTATASDPDAGDWVGKVSFYEDLDHDGLAETGELIGEDDVADGWSIQWDTKNHATGSVTLLAVAEDSTKALSAPRSLVLTINPAPVNQAPVVNTFTSNPASPITVGQTVTLTATASDPDAGDWVGKVSFYEDVNHNGVAETGELIGADDVADGWSMQWDTKNHATGSVTLLAVAEDSTKAVSAPRALALTLNPVPANQPPVVNTLTSNPASPIMVGQTVTLTATASDPDSSDFVTKVKFFRDANGNGVAEPSEILSTDVDVSDGWSISWNTTGLTAGPTTLLAVAYDLANLASAPRSLSVTLLADTTPPAVVGVYLRGTGWTSGFLNGLASSGLGSATLGYAVPVGSGVQLASLAWCNLDRVSIVFSEAVSVQQDDLQLTGTYTGSYNISGGTFLYDAASLTATWTLPAAIGRDKLTMTLSGSGTGAVVDGAGNRLDGEWVNPVAITDTGTDTFPSGNGTAGGDFSFRVNVLPGDSNQNLTVEFADLVAVAQHYNTVGGATWLTGDFTGNGNVDFADLVAVAQNYNRSVSIVASAPAVVLASGAGAVAETVEPGAAAAPVDVEQGGSTEQSTAVLSRGVPVQARGSVARSAPVRASALRVQGRSAAVRPCGGSVASGAQVRPDAAKGKAADTVNPAAACPPARTPPLIPAASIFSTRRVRVLDDSSELLRPAQEPGGRFLS